MKLIVFHLIPVLLAASAMVQFQNPGLNVNKSVGDPITFSFYGDPTATGGEPSDPFKTLTVMVALDTTKFTAMPVVMTPVPGASITPFLVSGSGYKFILVGSGDIAPKGELFEATFICPAVPGTYAFGVSSVTAVNSVGTPAAIALPVQSPDSIVVKAKAKPWDFILRYLK